MSEEKARAAISRLSQITTEMAARRELRDRGAEAARAASNESMRKIGPVAEKVAAHLGELGRRQREAGGWATQKTLADKDRVLGFGPEEDDAAEREFVPPYSMTSPAADPDTSQIGALDEDEHAVEARPAAPSPAPAREPEVDLFTPRGGARRRAPDREPEDDDFSDTSSWLQG